MMSERLRSCWGPSRLAHHSNIYSSQWNKHQNYIVRLISEQLRACSVCFQTAMWKKSAWFYEPQFGRISLNISILDSVLKLKKFKHKCWIWTAELFQFVKYCRTLTVWHFRQLWSLSTNQIIRTILPRILIGLFQYVLWEFKTYWRNFIRIENRIAKGIWLKKKGRTLD